MKLIKKNEKYILWVWDRSFVVFQQKVQTNKDKRYTTIIVTTLQKFKFDRLMFDSFIVRIYHSPTIGWITIAENQYDQLRRATVYFKFIRHSNTFLICSKSKHIHWNCSFFPVLIYTFQIPVNWILLWMNENTRISQFQFQRWYENIDCSHFWLALWNRIWIEINEERKKAINKNDLNM